MTLSSEQIGSILSSTVKQLWIAAGKPSTADELRDMLLKTGADDQSIVRVFRSKDIEIANKVGVKPVDIPGTTLGANTPMNGSAPTELLTPTKKVSKMATRLSKDQIKKILGTMGT